MCKFVKGLALLVGLLAIPGFALFAFLAYAFAEPRNIPAGSPIAWIFIPNALRYADLQADCGSVTFTKSYLECGGICGVSYFAEFGSNNRDAAKESKMLTNLRKYLPEFEIDVVDGKKDEICKRYIVRLYKDDYAGTR